MLINLLLILVVLKFEMPVNTGRVRDVASKLVVSSCKPDKH